MVIKPLSHDDFPTFYSWARKEGWTISFQEQRLFQNQWQPCFFTLWERGCCCGFISVVIYKTSGWIGNLLIHPEKRRKGYGSTLFDFALEQLEKNQLGRIWLTASAQGAGIYRQRGFVQVEQIIRWTGVGSGQRNKPSPSGSAATVEQLVQLDLDCWKESRRPLLRLLADDGIIFKEGGSMVLLQPGPEFWQAGPWLTPLSAPQETRRLLTAIIETTPVAVPLIMDIVESSSLDLLLRQHGFRIAGQNELMCKSQEPLDDLTAVTALASLGSIG
ncbi:Acetyltransferase (GNAT) domain-containing protein [Desulfuromusa kysingii]|uniref:Acetyltransferase (GNAT) domain-containing protein n=1 Tax=Desulfuromusa kysingii TaxID=37625 RepID=A0A1H4DJA9_9BACT|nr:GNAT family N-acetyltransferase [Desulfuromusa kysingii]SEA72302.1 Acetyltransferase (GNAT) domain-containing protein [Desulfuromusa kysingii]